MRALDGRLRRRVHDWGYNWDQLPPRARSLLYIARERGSYFRST